MSIKFACSCGKAYKVPEKFAGKRVKCKQCDEPIRVPSESEASVQSSRAAAVSKRSVMASQRVSRDDDDDLDAEDDAPPAKPAKASSGTSARKPTPATSARVETKRRGTGTGRFEAPNLEAELKAYQRKRSDEEFKRGEGRLTYFVGGKPAKAFRLGKDDVTVGRGASCKVALPVESVSNEHMKIEYKLGTFIVTDLQSLNGVVVNGRPVRRASVKDGDLIQLGEAILRIDC